MSDSVPISRNRGSSKNTDPVWSYEESLQAKCDKHDRPNFVCCRDLKGEDERSLLNPDLVRDIIIGVADGLTVPFALTAGLSSLGSSRLVYVAGLAELVSGAISMGIGGFLSAEAERDHYLYMRRLVRSRVLRSCEGEIQREVAKVLTPYGVDEKLAARIALRLLDLELRLDESLFETPSAATGVSEWISGIARKASNQAKTAADAVASNERTRLLPTTVQDLVNNEAQSSEAAQEPVDPDSGLTAFLLKFAEEVEEVDANRALVSAAVIGSSYFLAGLIPLIPYFFIPLAFHALFVSIAITTVTLLLFGSFKTYFSGAETGLRGYVKGCLSTLAVGGFASAASFVVVRTVEGSE